MSESWDYQIRIELDAKFAEIARTSPRDPALGQLPAVLAKHGAVLKCQFDAFAEFVDEAAKRGATGDPLYRWTKATIEDPAKKENYLKFFTLYAGGKGVYPKEIADALEADLQPLVGGDLRLRLFRHDTNPANNPQPPARYR